MSIALSAVVLLAAVAIEATADFQLDNFVAAAGIEGSTKGVCSQGLWCESVCTANNVATYQSCCCSQ
eukprot:COSAG02_NODE_286_length_25649_cov_13.411272_26_plen_67_part_00